MNEIVLPTIWDRLFAFFQLFFDDYVEPDVSSKLLREVSRPKESACSEATTHNSSGSRGEESMEMGRLRKEIQTLKTQCLTALTQAKKSSEREENALLQAKESVESAQVAALRMSQAASREKYMLELMTTASQDIIGKFSESPRAGFSSGRLTFLRSCRMSRRCWSWRSKSECSGRRPYMNFAGGWCRILGRWEEVLNYRPIPRSGFPSPWIHRVLPFFSFHGL